MSPMNRRTASLALGALAIAPFSGACRANPSSASAFATPPWPHKPVRIINPFPVGGGPDGT
ncbi:MAG: tripartite tricarboxylate transporter substrate binding protein, partial [Comamonas sp.]|nr:tripartite tricarboxylate transporter substrate binding protein [Candidatus Comamonas equi]